MTASLHGTNGLTLPDGSIMGRIPRSWLAGLTLSTAGSSATFSVAAGQAADSTNASLMDLSSAYSKTTSAWSVGSAAGALDTGAIANSTWYHVFLIKRVDTGVVDVLISTSASAPTMPTNYTLKRRIGSMKTNGSAQWTLFSQIGDEFFWSVSVSDISVTNLGATATLYALSAVPTGVKVSARGRGLWYNAAISDGVISSPEESDQAVDTPTGFRTVMNPVAGVSNAFVLEIKTDTSAQIRARSDTASTTLRWATYGWLDRRGKDD